MSVAVNGDLQNRTHGPSLEGEAYSALYLGPLLCTALNYTSLILFSRNASLVRNVEASGQYMVRYEEKEIREQIVQMLKGVRKEPMLVFACLGHNFKMC